MPAELAGGLALKELRYEAEMPSIRPWAGDFGFRNLCPDPFGSSAPM